MNSSYWSLLSDDENGGSPRRTTGMIRDDIGSDYYRWCELDSNNQLRFGMRAGKHDIVMLSREYVTRKYGKETLEFSGKNIPKYEYLEAVRKEILFICRNDPFLYTNIIGMLDHNGCIEWITQIQKWHEGEIL